MQGNDAGNYRSADSATWPPSRPHSRRLGQPFWGQPLPGERSNARLWTIDSRNGFWTKRRSKASKSRRWAAKAVYYIILIFAVVGFFNALQLTVISQPLTAFLNQLFEYIPKLIGAGVLVLTAWLLATLLRKIVSGALEMAKLDERLGGEAGLKRDKAAPLSKTLADAVYWLVFLLFLPAILSALPLEGLLTPVQNLVDKILSFLPNILAAGVILAVGWFIAPGRAANRHQPTCRPRCRSLGREGRDQ